MKKEKKKNRYMGEEKEWTDADGCSSHDKLTGGGTSV